MYAAVLLEHIVPVFVRRRPVKVKRTLIHTGVGDMTYSRNRVGDTAGCSRQQQQQQQQLPQRNESQQQTQHKLQQQGC